MFLYEYEDAIYVDHSRTIFKNQASLYQEKRMARELLVSSAHAWKERLARETAIRHAYLGVDTG